MPVNIAIDGPSGSGKSTAAKGLAKALGYVYIDTGALYRAIGLFALRSGADPKSAADVAPLLSGINLELRHGDDGQRVLLNGEDVSGLIRTPEVSMAASAVSALPEVRRFLLGMQREIAARSNCVMDGRDIGTVILPDAQVKIFLTASAEDRARRRTDELCEKGVDVRYEDVLREMTERDRNDSSRDIAPLRPAGDAVLFDNSGMTPGETLSALKKIIKDRLGDEVL